MGKFKKWCGQSGHMTLKITVSQDWADGINWFFACCCKFRKFYAMISRRAWSNMGGVMVREPLKSAYLKNEFMNWADFFHAHCGAIIFG